MGRDTGGVVVTFGELGGVDCSIGLFDRDISGLLCSCLSGIAICCGESCCFPVIEEGCDSFQDGPSS